MWYYVSYVAHILHLPHIRKRTSAGHKPAQPGKSRFGLFGELVAWQPAHHAPGPGRHGRHPHLWHV